MDLIKELIYLPCLTLLVLYDGKENNGIKFCCVTNLKWDCCYGLREYEKTSPLFQTSNFLKLKEFRCNIILFLTSFGETFHVSAIWSSLNRYQIYILILLFSPYGETLHGFDLIFLFLKTHQHYNKYLLSKKIITKINNKINIFLFYPTTTLNLYNFIQNTLCTLYTCFNTCVASN